MFLIGICKQQKWAVQNKRVSFGEGHRLTRMSNAWSLGSNNHRLFVAKLVPCLIGYFSATNRGASYPANMVDLFRRAWEVLVPEMAHSQYTSQGNCCLRFAWLGWLDKWVLGLGSLSKFSLTSTAAANAEVNKGLNRFRCWEWDVSSAFPIWTFFNLITMLVGFQLSIFACWGFPQG